MRDTVLDAIKAAGRKDVVDALNERRWSQILPGPKAGHRAKVYIPGEMGKHQTTAVGTSRTTSPSETNTSSMEQSPGEKRLLRVGMELISPIFVYGDAKSRASGFRAVFERLNEFIQWKPNRSTGLHVNVALEHRMFKMEEIRSLQSVLIFEVCGEGNRHNHGCEHKIRKLSDRRMKRRKTPHDLSFRMWLIRNLAGMSSRII
jgi:hypothetical protein